MINRVEDGGSMMRTLPSKRPSTVHRRKSLLSDSRNLANVTITPISARIAMVGEAMA
jgi:hypothetical protein